jgi:hypothetical protein
LTFFVLDAETAGYGLTTVALGFAVLDAATGVCLGCVAWRRMHKRQSS